MSTRRISAISLPPQLIVPAAPEFSLKPVADTLAKLAEAEINVTASAATGAGSGRYGMILWVAPADYERAADALGV